MIVSQTFILNLHLLKISMSVIDMQDDTRDRTQNIKFHTLSSPSNDMLQQLISFGLCASNIFCQQKKNTLQSKVR